MANVSLNPPKVQEAVTFRATPTGNPQAFPPPPPPSAPPLPPVSVTPAPARFGGASVTGGDAAAAAWMDRISDARSKSTRSRTERHHRRKQQRLRLDKAVPADFANLINSDKVKPDADTETLFSPDNVENQEIPKSKEKKSKKKRHKHESDTESEGSASSSSSSGSESSTESSGSESSSSSSDTDRGRSNKQPAMTNAYPPIGAPNTALIMDKAKVLARLERRRKTNKCQVQFDTNMSLEELMTIDEKCRHECLAENAISCLKRAVVFIVGITERVVENVHIKGFNLEGWAEYVFLNMDQFEENCNEIYDRYPHWFQMNPLVNLAMSLVSNAWMYSMAKMTTEAMRNVFSAGQGGNPHAQFDPRVLEEMIKKAVHVQQQNAPTPSAPATAPTAQAPHRPLPGTATATATATAKTPAAKKRQIVASSMKPPAGVSQVPMQMQTPMQMPQTTTLDASKIMQQVADAEIRRVDLTTTTSSARKATKQGL